MGETPARRRLILVGEQPGGRNPSLDPRHALTGSSGRNLCRIAGWDWLVYLRHTARFNVFPDQRPWDNHAAALAAMYLILGIAGEVPVILLGNRVAEAFGFDDRPLYEFFVPGVLTRVARVPHPSGLNRVWNDPAERARARAFLRDLL